MDERTSIQKIVQKVNKLNGEIGNYDSHVTHSISFDFSVKTTNGRLTITKEQTQDEMRGTLSDQQLMKIVSSFVSRYPSAATPLNVNPTPIQNEQTKPKSVMPTKVGKVLLYILGVSMIATSFTLLKSGDSFLTIALYIIIGFYCLPITHQVLNKKFNLKFGLAQRIGIGIVIMIITTLTIRSNFEKASDAFNNEDIEHALSLAEAMSTSEALSPQGTSLLDKIYNKKAMAELENARLKESLAYFRKISSSGRTTTIDSIIRGISVLVLKSEVFGWWKGGIEGVQEESIRFTEDGAFHFNRFFENYGKAQVYYEKGSWAWDGFSIKTRTYESSLLQSVGSSMEFEILDNKTIRRRGATFLYTKE